MNLRELKPSITEMALADVMELHKERRKSRLTPKETSSKAQAKRKSTAKRISTIKRDPETIRAILRALGEDV